MPDTLNRSNSAARKPAVRLALLLSAALLTALPVAAQTAMADSATPLERILDHAPPACTPGAFDLLAQQMRADAPRVVMEGLRRARGFDATWAPGDDNYDKVLGYVTGAFDEYEKTLGPLAPLTWQDLRQQAFSRMRVENLAYLADFFERPAGQLYWDQILGGAECAGVLQGIAADRLSPTERFALDQWRRQGEAAHRQFLAGMAGLSPADRKDFTQGSAKMGKGITGGAAQAAGALALALRDNAQKALLPRQGDIKEALDTYAAAQAAEAAVPAAMPATTPVAAPVTVPDTTPAASAATEATDGAAGK